MSVQVREAEADSESGVSRRPLTQKECAGKVSQALVFGLLIFAAAIALPATIAHFLLGYLALRQFYVVSYWSGLQRRLRHGAAIEIVTTPGVTRGYVPSFSVAMLATMVAFVCTFVTLLTFLFSPAPRGDEVMYLAFASLGLCWTAWRLWRKAVPPPVERAVIRQTLGSRTRSSAGSDPLAFDLEGTAATPNTSAGNHPVSQRRHWWTDSQLRDENKPDAGR